jgi:hypothetical protein
VVPVLERHQLSYADRYVQRKVSHSNLVVTTGGGGAYAAPIFFLTKHSFLATELRSGK